MYRMSKNKKDVGLFKGPNDESANNDNFINEA